MALVVLAAPAILALAASCAPRSPADPTQITCRPLKPCGDSLLEEGCKTWSEALRDSCNSPREKGSMRLYTRRSVQLFLDCNGHNTLQLEGVDFISRYHYDASTGSPVGTSGDGMVGPRCSGVFPPIAPRCTLHRGGGVCAALEAGLSLAPNDLAPGKVFESPIVLLWEGPTYPSECASDVVIDGLRCKYSGPPELFPGEGIPGSWLSPYDSLDGVKLLIPGLLEQPSVEAWLAERAPRKVNPRSLRKGITVAICTVQLVQEVTKFHVRHPPGPWHEAYDPAWVARASDCRIRELPPS